MSSRDTELPITGEGSLQARVGLEGRDGALAVVVTVTDESNPPRAPTSTEVQSLKLLTADAAR